MGVGELAAFAAVARAGGIPKAAQMLNSVQSNMTQRIRLLEAEIGVPRGRMAIGADADRHGGASAFRPGRSCGRLRRWTSRPPPGPSQS